MFAIIKNKREDDSVKNFLLRCQLNQKPVEIMYLSNSGEVSQRTITIRDIHDSKIKAYCHLRRTQRVFKLENILSINYKRAAS
jgi:predicted DNA-binding transcriptional regulator YafY